MENVAIRKCGRSSDCPWTPTLMDPGHPASWTLDTQHRGPWTPTTSVLESQPRPSGARASSLAKAQADSLALSTHLTRSFPGRSPDLCVSRLSPSRIYALSRSIPDSGQSIKEETQKPTQSVDLQAPRAALWARLLHRHPMGEKRGRILGIRHKTWTRERQFFLHPCRILWPGAASAYGSY